CQLVAGAAGTKIDSDAAGRGVGDGAGIEQRAAVLHEDGVSTEAAGGDRAEIAVGVGPGAKEAAAGPNADAVQAGGDDVVVDNAVVRRARVDTDAEHSHGDAAVVGDLIAGSIGLNA